MDDSFFIDLEALLRKHKVVITACGCCDSPYILSEKDAKQGGTPCSTIDECIEHLRDNNLTKGD